MKAAPRIPFMSLRPGEDAREVRAGIDRVIERGCSSSDLKSRRSSRNSPRVRPLACDRRRNGTEAIA